MKKATKFDLRTLLVLILSVTLCFTAVFAACSGNDDSSSSSSSSSTEEATYPTDTQLLKNGDFEYSTFTKKDTDFPVSSSISWTIGSDSVGSSSAPSSSSNKYPSGIIDTDDEAYDAIKDSKNLPEVNPRTPEYYKLVNSAEMYSMDKFNNDTENEDKLPMSGTKVLMLHNHTTTDGEGTARKFTSSSVTLARNEYAELSVWIKTVDLTSQILGADYGAYIAVQSTISSSAAPLVLKNINTDGNWAKYTVYLSSSDFSTSSFKLVLGLGFGSATITDEFVQGYAFFDNAVFKTISKTDYDAAVDALDADKNLNLYEIKPGETVYTEKAKSEFVKSQKGTTYTANGTDPYEGDYNETTAKTLYTEVKYGLSHTRDSKLGSDVVDKMTNGSFVKNEGNDAEAATIGTMSEAYTAARLTNDDDKLPGADSAKALYLVFDQVSSYSYTTEKLALESGEYLKLSFWVKAEVENAMYKNALTVTLKDLGKKDANEEGSDVVETVLLDNKNTNDYENENYNGWLQYVLFVSNTIDEDSTTPAAREFEIEFTFGTSAEDYTNDWDLTKGFAIVGNFEGYYMSASDYSIADTSSYTYSKKVALSADLKNGVSSDESDDSYNYNYPETDKLNLAISGTTNSVNGYQFVKAGSNAVGGNSANVYGSNATDVNGGLISSKHNTNFKDLGLTPFNNNKELLSMYIGAKTEPVSYGFIGSSATFAANSTTYVSVSVYATNGAKAYFYLTSPDALDGFRVLSLTAIDYAIDDETLTFTYKKDADDKYIYKVNEKFEQSLEGTAGDAKWYTLSFLVTTGNESISYRPEFWLGSRDGSGSIGTVYFDNYVTTTVSLNEKKAELKNMGASETDVKKYTRVPSVIKYNEVISDEDSSESASENSDVKKYFEKYSETDVYARYEATDLTVLSYDFSTIDVEHEIDRTTVSVDDDEDSSSSEDSSVSDGTDFNWALQLTSIIIAAVLIILLVVVLVKMLLDRKPRKTRTEQYYDRSSREEAGEKALKKQAQIAAKADENAEEDVEEYDYDNPEINNNDLLNAPQDETAEDGTLEETETAEDADAGEGSDEPTDPGDGSAE